MHPFRTRLPALFRASCLSLALGLIALLLPGAHAAPPPKVETPSPADAKYPPHEPGPEVKLKSVQVLRKSGTYDFKFKVLRWVGKGRCNQKENQSAMFEIKGDHIVLKNAFIIGAPDGIHVRGHDVKLENLYFMDVCEDAITSAGATDLDITGCYFYDAEDKVLQLNEGRDIEIYGNVFYRFGCAVRVKNDASGVQVRNNLFLEGSRAVFANGKDARVIYLDENLAVKVGNFAFAEEKSRITLNRHNHFQHVGTIARENGGGKVDEE